MGWLSSLILAFIAYIFYRKDKKIYSPVVLFAGFWSLLCFLSSMQLYGLYGVSDLAYVCVFIGVLSFTVGCVLADRQTIRTRKEILELSQTKFKFMLLLCVLGLVMNLEFIFTFIRSGLDLSMIYILMAQTGSGIDTELSDQYNSNNIVIQQYLGYPLLYTIMPISICKYIEEKKRKYLFIAIALFLIRFLFDIRRTFIVILAVFVIFYLIIRRTELGRNRKGYGLLQSFKRMTFKQKLLVLTPIVLILFVFSLLSAIRSGDEGDNYSLFSNFYFYYAASLTYFSERLDMLANPEYTLGLTSFRGVFAPLFAILEIVGFGKPHLMNVANDNVYSLHATALHISPDGMFNSYATSFFEFYLDGGIIGVIVISLLFGFVSYMMYKKMIYFKTERYIWKYSYWISIFIYLSVLHFNAVVVCYIWPFVLERFFYSRQCGQLVKADKNN